MEEHSFQTSEKSYRVTLYIILSLPLRAVGLETSLRMCEPSPSILVLFGGFWDQRKSEAEKKVPS